MSFLGALVLITIEHDDVLAWIAFVRILDNSELKRLYTNETPKLFELTNEIDTFIQKELPNLHQTLKHHNVILESLFASPFFTLFSNLIPLNQALVVLDNFILDGQKIMIDIMKHLFA